jgi:non-specific serine/threonine protein kinase/serine/threonine-protein kinase
MDASERQASVVTPGQQIDRREAETVDVPPDTGRELAVRCPHCHAPASVWAEGDLAAVKCPECGSDFSLISDPVASDAPLQSVGHFELLEKLGSGAFGTVWKARDTKLDRTVAVKIPRHGSMSADEQQKFFREARAAAQLRHPNIVSVHEVGRDGDTVYIVSDFIHGSTLGDWLAGQKRTSREAAELCAKIADALHHAHEQGVVHRDLKPANIMIDASGQPHLMDFGLARREVGEATVTLDGVLMGTPAYMSPEQAAFKSHTADRRSDVYSLGVILFELLTGERPFRGNIEMIIQQVIQDEPPSPRKLNARISKDLETITLKCLEKDPSRRYQSANEFSEEIRRHLSGNPIKARPISRVARSLRWAKRRPAAAALLVLLALAAAGSAAAFVRERELRHDLAAQKLEADRHRTEAESERDTAQAIVTFLTDDVLAKASPKNTTEKWVRDLLVEMLIENAADSVSQRFKDRPRVEAAVQARLASILNSLGRSELGLEHATRALELRRKNLGPDHPDTIESLHIYATLLDSSGRPREAEPLLKQAVDKRRTLLGEDHPDTIESLHNYAALLDELGRYKDAEPLYKKVLEQSRNALGEDNSFRITVMQGYALCLENQGREREAEPVIKQALAQARKVLGKNHPNTILCLYNYAFIVRSLGRAQEAEPLFKEALDQSHKVLGEDHPKTIVALDGYAGTLMSLGREQEAEPLLKRVLVKNRKVLGNEHPDTLIALHNYAFVLRRLGRLEQAEPLYKQALEQSRKKLGPDHPGTITTLNNYAGVLHSLGRAQEAEPLYKEGLELRRNVLGERHPDTITTLNNYGALLNSLGRAHDAEPLLKRAAELSRDVKGPHHRDTVNALHNYASVLKALDRSKEAEPLFKEVMQLRRKVLGEEHPDTIASLNNYAKILNSMDRVQEAETIYKQALGQGRKVLGNAHPGMIAILDNYGALLQSLGREEEADVLLKEAQELRTAAEEAKPSSESTSAP